jgi:integrase
MRPQIAALANSWTDAYKPNTASHYIGALRRICRFVDEAAGTKLAPMVPRGPATEARTVTATDAEFSRLLLFSPPWFRTFLLLTRTVAMRKTEAMAITPDHLNPQTNSLSFHRKMEGTSHIPLTPELASLFAQCGETAPGQPVIETLAGFKPCDNTLYRQWQRAKKRAGITRDLTFHDLRRTAAEQVYNRTRDLRICQRLLGHRNLRSTLNYIGGFNTDELREAILDAAPKDIHSLPLPTERPQ